MTKSTTTLKLNKRGKIAVGIMAATVVMGSVGALADHFDSAQAKETKQVKTVKEVKMIEGRDFTFTPYTAITKPEETKILSAQIELEPNESYIKYMVEKFYVPEKRAREIIQWIEDTNTDVSTTLILGIIENETSFRNEPSEFVTEDSMGYVQMQSETREWLRKLYPELPYVASQEDFQAVPKVQIQYMVKYLEHAINKYGYDSDWVVSCYNMGMYNKKFNDKYVGRVMKYKNDIEQFHNILVAQNN